MQTNMKRVIIILLFILPIYCIGQLSTSNLKLSAIIDTLNDISATSLSDVSLSSNVNKYGLDAVYCPGSDADARLLSLQTDKIMSYFKGYKHTPYLCNFFITSGGYSEDTVLYQIKLNAVEGVFRLNYQAFWLKDYFDLYDGENIIDGTVIPVSGGSYAGNTYDGEYNYPLWHYHDGVEEDTIYIRTYAPDTGTLWSFAGKCPFVATENQNYTQNEGVALYYEDINTQDWQLQTTSTDTVYFKAFDAITRTLLAEGKLMSPNNNYQYSGVGLIRGKFVLVSYSRNNVSYTIKLIK